MAPPRESAVYQIWTTCLSIADQLCRRQPSESHIPSTGRGSALSVGGVEIPPHCVGEVNYLPSHHWLAQRTN